MCTSEGVIGGDLHTATGLGHRSLQTDGQSAGFSDHAVRKSRRCRPSLNGEGFVARASAYRSPPGGRPAFNGLERAHAKSPRVETPQPPKTPSLPHPLEILLPTLSPNDRGYFPGAGWPAREGVGGSPVRAEGCTPRLSLRASLRRLPPARAGEEGKP